MEDPHFCEESDTVRVFIPFVLYHVSKRGGHKAGLHEGSATSVKRRRTHISALVCTGGRLASISSLCWSVWPPHEQGIWIPLKVAQGLCRPCLSGTFDLVLQILRLRPLARPVLLRHPHPLLHFLAPGLPGRSESSGFAQLPHIAWGSLEFAVFPPCCLKVAGKR